MSVALYLLNLRVEKLKLKAMCKPYLSRLRTNVSENN
jgi:hypothetical protein